MAVNLRQNHFRFGLNSGNEATHGWLGNEDAAISFTPGVTFLLRIHVQEAGGTGQNNLTETWQYNLNGAGWVNITTTSAAVKSVTPKTWANVADCTNRLSGSGTFVANNDGCTTDGTAGSTNNDIAASGQTETEIALQIVPGGVSNGDTLQFMVVGSTAISIDVTPSLTVDKKSYVGSLLTTGWLSIIRVLKVLTNQALAELSFSGSIAGVKAGGEALWDWTGAGVLSAAGAFTRRINNLTRRYLGSISLSGVYSRKINNLTRRYLGTLSSVGVYSRSINKLSRFYSGALSLSGAYTRLINKLTRSASSVLSFSGEYLYISGKGAINYGVLSLTGTLSRLINNLTRAYSGAVSFVSSLSYVYETAPAALYDYTADGLVSLAGSFIRLLRFFRTKAGALSLSGTLSRLKLLPKTKAGAISSAGSFTRRINNLTRSKFGTITLAGIISYVNRRILKTGILTLSGVVTNTSGRVRRLTFTGWLSIIRVSKYLSNQTNQYLSFVGTVVGYFGSSLPIAGSLSPSGILRRTISRLTRTLSGSLSSVGTTIGQKWGYGLFTSTRAGVLSLAGSIIDILVSTPYTYIKNRAISFIGTVSKRKTSSKTKDGSLTFTKYLTWAWGGFVSVEFFRTVSGALGLAGSLLYSLFRSRTQAGVLALVGTIRRIFTISRIKAGSVSISGIIEDVWQSGTQHLLSRSKSGQITFSGAVLAYAVISDLFGGRLSLVGLVSSVWALSRAKSSSMSFRGRVYGDRITDALYYGTPSP